MSPTAPCFHSPSPDPRKDSCVKCGRLFTPPEPEPDARDFFFEEKFLLDALEMAQRTTGITNFQYQQLVWHRLAVGHERYGANNFLKVDNLREVREETPDIAAYAVLELQKQRRQGLDPEVLAELRLDLVAAAAYGAVADYFAQRASLLLRGEE